MVAILVRRALAGREWLSVRLAKERTDSRESPLTQKRVERLRVRRGLYHLGDLTEQIERKPDRAHARVEDLLTHRWVARRQESTSRLSESVRDDQRDRDERQHQRCTS